MLAARFDFYNMALDTTSTPATVTVIDTAQPGYMVAVFPPQHVGEQALADPGTQWPPGNPPFQGVLSRPSWIAFETSGTIDFTLLSLLSWEKLTPQLVPVAVPTPGALPTPPSPQQTSLEVPWSLVLSPNAKGTWHHSPTPVTHGGVTELWQTRLGQGKHLPPEIRPSIQAVWSPGYPSSPADPFQMSLAPTDRDSIVTLTSGGSGIPSAPVPADLLMLTPLGASVQLNGSWAPGPTSGISLIGWAHRTSTGRDSYVRTVYQGYLFPTGHRAVLTVVTNRLFVADPTGDVVANLVQSTYLDVVEKTVTYKGNASEPSSGRQNPLRKITIKTLATPPLDTTSVFVNGFPTNEITSSAIFVRSGGKDVPFTYLATDAEGRIVHFVAPALWVADAALRNVSNPVGLLNTAFAGFNPIDFGGQLLAFAEPAAKLPGRTAQVVDSYGLSAIASLAPTELPGYFPAMADAAINLPAAEQMTGQTGPSPSTATTVSFNPTYQDQGFATQGPEVYLDVPSPSVGPSLVFPGLNMGGIVSPNFTVDCVTRDTGPAGGLPADLLGGNFTPSSVFPTGQGALLLGFFELSSLLVQYSQDVTHTDGQLPKLLSSFSYPHNDKSKPPTAIDTTLDWSPVLQSSGAFGGGSLTLHARIHTPFADPTAATYTVDCALTKFSLSLIDSSAQIITISFDSIRVRSATGAKPHVETNVRSVTFIGDLSFVGALSGLLSSIGGPKISATKSGLTASYALPLPDVSVGVFSLQNLSIDAGLTVPYNAFILGNSALPIRARFGLCSREHPFLLAVDFFGGGGFFSVALGPDGFESLEVSLEFGAAVALDFGVASGSASIMAGIYFELQENPQNVQLTGFLRADGSIEVLGILSLTIELYLGFTYDITDNAAIGQATLTISVKVLFFSASVKLNYQKTISGSAGSSAAPMLTSTSSPTYPFGQAISQTDWTGYCGSFGIPPLAASLKG